MKWKQHARRRRRRRRRCKRIITTWRDALGNPAFRMGHDRGKYFIERFYLHYPGLAGLAVRRPVTKAEALTFTPDQWVDSV